MMWWRREKKPRRCDSCHERGFVDDLGLTTGRTFGLPTLVRIFNCRNCGWTWGKLGG